MLPTLLTDLYYQRLDKPRLVEPDGMRVAVALGTGSLAPLLVVPVERPRIEVEPPGTVEASSQTRMDIQTLELPALAVPCVPRIEARVPRTPLIPPRTTAFSLFSFSARSFSSFSICSCASRLRLSSSCCSARAFSSASRRAFSICAFISYSSASSS